MKTKIRKTRNIILGSFLLGLGVVLANMSNFGADPLSYFWHGLSIRFHITLGSASLYSTLALGLVPLFLDRKEINLGTLISPLVISFTIDTLSAPQLNKMSLRIIALILAVLTYSLGVAIYYYQNYGRSTYDACISILGKMARLSYSKSKLIIDAIFYVLAIYLGAIAQIGPFIFTVCAGPLINYFIHQIEQRQETT